MFKENIKQDDDKTNCVICREHFIGDWIQCNVYKDSTYENCATLEGASLLYKCEVGMFKIKYKNL